MQHNRPPGHEICMKHAAIYVTCTVSSRIYTAYQVIYISILLFNTVTLKEKTYVQEIH